MTKPVESDKTTLQQNKRKKIGLIDTDPQNSRKSIEGLTAPQQALREAAINHFKANKVRAFIEKQIKHINVNRQISEGIRFLFDKNGNPPANIPLEDIIDERKKIEAQIHWLEALCSEMRNQLSKAKEIEDLALESMGLDPGKV